MNLPENDYQILKLTDAIIDKDELNSNFFQHISDFLHIYCTKERNVHYDFDVVHYIGKTEKI